MILHKFSHLILKNPKTTLGIIFSITIYFGYVAFLSENKLITDFSMEQLSPKDDPEKDIFDSFLQKFPREDGILFIVYKCDDCFSNTALRATSDLTEELEFLEGVLEVTSLTNIIGEEFSLNKLSLKDRENKKNNIINNPIYANLLTSQAGDIATIIIKLDDEIRNHETRKEIITKIDELLIDFPYQWYEAGIPFIRTKYVEFVMRERDIFIPLAFLVSIIVLYLVFRQIKSIILSMVSISVTLIWVSGIMALTNISINVISYLTYNLLTIIGVSDCIHILIKYHEKLYQRCGKLKAIDGVIKEIGSALFLTSFTTAVGFFSLLFTNIRIVQEFGFIVGVGAILMFILTITIVPLTLNYIALPDIHHIKRLVEGGRLQTAGKLNYLINKHPKRILVVTVFIISISIYGIININDNPSILNDFRPENEIYDSIKFVDNNLGGVFPVEIIIEKADSSTIVDLNMLLAIDEFQDSIRTIDGVGSVKSIVDILKMFNRSDTGKLEIPSNIEEIQSYLLLGKDISKIYLTDNDKTVRITARVIAGTIDELNSLKEKVHHLGMDIIPNNSNIQVTGSIILMAKTNKYLVNNLLTSFILAFTVIFFSMMFLFQSKRLALLSILPNIIPLMFAGGMMGILGIILRPSTAMTFTIALGIAVDDTIHFLSRFKQEYIKYNGNYSKAINRTLLTTGKAISSTTTVITLGFMVMLFSEYVPNFEFGILGSEILIIALLCSLVLLPVLIILFKPRFRYKIIMDKNK